ncbi:hypothetical protein QFZ66_000017 [Streptomyces sp. B4I13]|nr:hypothetical protein [Streptomyces sp. B4I13]
MASAPVVAVRPVPVRAGRGVDQISPPEAVTTVTLSKAPVPVSA